LKQASVVVIIIFRISMFFGRTCGADEVEDFGSEGFNIDVAPAEIFQE
jgi:hypothetical protein